MTRPHLRYPQATLLIVLTAGFLGSTLASMAHASQTAIHDSAGSEATLPDWSLSGQGPRVTKALDRLQFDDDERRTSLAASQLPPEMTPDALLLVRLRRF